MYMYVSDSVYTYVCMYIHVYMYVYPCTYLGTQHTYVCACQSVCILCIFVCRLYCAPYLNYFCRIIVYVRTYVL